MGKKNNLGKYVELLDEDIFNKVQGSFTLLLSNLNEIINNNKWSSIYEKPKDLIDVEDFIFDCYKNIKKILADSNDLHKEKMAELFSNKQTIIKIERTLQTYAIFLQRIEYFIEQNMFLGEIKPDALTLAKEDIIAPCIEFIKEADAEEYSSRMQSVIACFPVRMAKEKYFDYIHSGFTALLMREDKALINSIVQMYKIIISPGSAPEYGLYFPEFIRDMQSLQDLALENNTGTKNLIELLENYHNEIVQIRDRLFLVYESLNFLIIVISCAPDMDFIFDENFILKDLHYIMSEGIEPEVFDQRIKELLELEIEKAVTRIGKSNEKAKKIMHDLSMSEIPDEFKNLCDIWDTSYYYFYENLLDSAFLLNSEQESEETSEEIIKREVDILINLLREVLAKESPKMQRLLKNYFITPIPCTYTIEEFKDYIVFCLESCEDSQKTMIIAYKLFKLFTDNGFRGLSDEDMEHIHHHDADCGCGHQH